jgi:cellulose synthase/poly-beta-1,6-N-acetylglucosamine synthase-like glycosyltransferase
LGRGLVPPAVLRRARAEAQGARLALTDTAALRGAIPAQALERARARAAGLRCVDPLHRPPDPRLIDRLGAPRCLALGLVPCRRIGSLTIVAVADPAAARTASAELDAAFGRWTAALAPPAAIAAAIAAMRRPALARRAETRAPAAQSCRSWPVARLRAALPALAAGLLLAILAAPQAVLLALTAWGVAMLLAVLALRLAALWLALARPAVAAPDPPPDRLPRVSVIVPLYREAGIAPRLLRRLGRIDYPRGLFEVVLALEADDAETRAALDAAPLPGWMRVVTVPPGAVRTKPRALNYALDFCRGEIIGIWDAEDAPAPDQIARVVARLANRPAEVACLQGVLDYYNPRTNWIARCFTIEYAAWFRIILPGIARLGLPVPLGGTTCFVRRAALEAVGAWDAHNVTEDAELGIRLARAGFRTEMIETVTAEEANCHPGAWIRQRSRWIKGHLITWAAQMRAPRALWRDLGPRRFIGYQVIFLGAQTQVLLAPLMWSFWLLAAGFGHPLLALIGPAGIAALVGLFLAAEAATIAAGIAGVRRAGDPGLWPWAPTLHLYFPLATLAGWRALVEAFIRPYHWAKTAHGFYDTAAEAAPRVRTSPASIFRRVSKAREICVRSAP